MLSDGVRLAVRRVVRRTAASFVQRAQQGLPESLLLLQSESSKFSVQSTADSELANHRVRPARRE